MNPSSSSMISRLWLGALLLILIGPEVTAARGKKAEWDQAVAAALVGSIVVLLTVGVALLARLFGLRVGLHHGG